MGGVSLSINEILKHKNEFPPWIVENTRKRIIVQSRKNCNRHLLKIMRKHIKKHDVNSNY